MHKALGADSSPPPALARGPARLISIPPGLPFLELLARRWLDGAEDPAEGLILLPTRRAARALADAFLAIAPGRALLLPRILAVGALGEAVAPTAGLPPPVEALWRQAALTRLILRLDGQGGAPRVADLAWPLAGELAALIDEAELAQIDLHRALPGIAAPEYAAHWQKILEFLKVITDIWPAELARMGASNPSSHLSGLLQAQAAAWRAVPPPGRVWAGGFGAAIPAVSDLLATIIGLEQGLVLLPGLDRTLDEAAWDRLPESHPQAGLARILRRLGRTRADVPDWPGPDGAEPSTGARAATLFHALAPAAQLAFWRDLPPPDLAGIARIEPADEQEEARAIALILRDALEQPGRRAALITPDHALARGVAAELRRFGIIADDSAGVPLALVPAAIFLRLLAAAQAEGFGPVALLALLKHPLCALGLPAGSCRVLARRLELAVLRASGATPLDIAALRRAIPAEDGELVAFTARLDAALAPLRRLPGAPDAALGALMAAAEALAAGDATSGADRLWAGVEGAACLRHLEALRRAAAILPDQDSARLPQLIKTWLEGPVVRRPVRRTGRSGVFIWGLMEARLQHVDVAVLGGLTEALWPPATDPGAWMSQSMRRTLGLATAEDTLGGAAWDFVMASCAAPRIVYSSARRRGGAPSVPARWLLRLDAFAAAHRAALPTHPAVDWARRLDVPPALRPATRPQPRPPVAWRPTSLSVTEVETWYRDPYAIHARHILGLEPLAPLGQMATQADYGSLVHAGLKRFFDRHRGAWPEDAAAGLAGEFAHALADLPQPPLVAVWLRPRLANLADWLAEQEVDLRGTMGVRAVRTEIGGALDVTAGFRLRGRADRIDQLDDGTLRIVDYKMGQVPTRKSVVANWSPQLALEAAIAAGGGFALGGAPAGLFYIYLSGKGDLPGRLTAIATTDAEAAQLAESALACLRRWVVAYGDVATPYLAFPTPAQAPRFAPYAQLARVAEWASDTEEEGA